MAEEQNRTWTDRYMLRLPDGMRDRIKAAAESNNRSMNAEIVALLEEKFPPEPKDSDVFKAMHLILEQCLRHPKDLGYLESFINVVAEAARLPAEAFEIDGDDESWIGVNYTTRSGRKMSIFSEFLPSDEYEELD